MIIIEPSSALPLCHVHLALRGGSAHDPDQQPGLARIASELLRRGAGGRTRAELDAAFDALGGSFEIDADHDHVTLGGTVLARNLKYYLKLVGDLLAAPALDPGELAVLLREARGELDDLRDDDRALVRRFFDRALYGRAHPYGRPTSGTHASLRRITLEDVRGWVRRWVVADNLTIGLGGALGPRGAAARHAETLLARLPGGRAPRSPVPAPPPRPRARRLLLVDKPARTQSQILMGHPGLRWSAPDFVPLEVVMTGFGGTFTARLMTEVRVKRGWSYGARARLERARGVAAFSMHVFPSAAQTPDTIALVHRLYDELCAGGLSDDEVGFARTYLSRSFAFDIDSPDKRLWLRMQAWLHGLPDDYLTSYPRRVAAVTPAHARRAMARHLDPGALLTTLVATAKTLQKKLPPGAGRVEVVRFDRD